MNTDESLFSIIQNTIRNYNDKNAYICRKENSVVMRTYQQVHNEYLEFDYHLNRIPKNVCVGLYMKNNPCILMLIYSFLEKGICFIFLDPDDTVEKTSKIIKDLKLYTIICCGAHDSFALLKSKTRMYKTRYGCEHHMWYGSYLNPDIPIVTYDNVCYVMRTSGTCGEKKYVYVTEECIKSNIISLRERLNIMQEDVIFFGTPLTFDPCLVELFLSLTIGATLIAVSDEIRESPKKLLNSLFLRAATFSVTVMQMCPSVFLRWPDENIDFLFNNSSLRVLALGGEPFPEQLITIKRRKELKLFNLYGITEVSCWATCCEIRDNVFLGDALSDTLLEVRDKNGGVVKDGHGELFIGSNTRICLVNNENMENLKLPLFRPTGDIVHISDNVCTYKGRTNRIIKRFGHRVNLAVLERNVYTSINLVNVCLWHLDLQKISTFIVIENANNSKEKILDKIRGKLLKDLGSQYFPDTIHIIDALPLTGNGKVDMKRLETIAVKNLSETNSLTNVHIYRNLWHKYFNLSREEGEARKSCTFTEMGGPSILKLQFVTELKSLTGTKFDANFINVLLDSSFEYACKHMEMNSLMNFVNDSTNDGEHEESHLFKINWKYNMHSCIDTTATLIHNNNRVYAAVGNFIHFFVALDIENGEELSSLWLPNTVENACVASTETNQVLVGCFDGGMYCLDIHLGKVVWKHLTEERIKNTGCLCNNNMTLVFGSYDKHLYCVDLKDGSLLWKVNLHEPITSNPQSKDGLILVGCIKGTIVGLNEKNGQTVWTFEAKHPIFTSPEIVGKMIIYSDVCGYIYGLDLKTGKQMWIYEPTSSSNMYSSFLIHENLIVFGMKNKNIYILEFNEEKCTLRQSLYVNYEIGAKPALLMGKLGTYFVFVGVDGLIFLYKYVNQLLLLIDFMSLGGMSFATPVMHKNNLLIGCRDNHLYSITINV